MARIKVVLSEKDIDKIEALSGYGLTVEKIAAIFAINKKTFERICKRDKRVKVALERGRSAAEAAVTQSLFDQATKGKNVSAAIFWLKCRAQWRDPNVVRHEGLENKTEPGTLIIDLSGTHTPKDE